MSTCGSGGRDSTRLNLEAGRGSDAIKKRGFRGGHPYLASAF
jgi:hypothetical protein